MIQTNPAQLDDFTGGITDFPIDGAQNKYEEADNLIITVNGKLRTVNGSAFLDESKPQLPTGNQRINALINFENRIFAYSNTKLFEEDTAWDTVTTVAGKDVFSNGDVNTKISHTEWNNQLFLTNDEFSKVNKVFYNDLGALTSVTAGLPKMAAPNASGGAGGGNNYILGFHYVWTYKVGDIEYDDVGPVTFIQLTDIDEPDTTPIVITGIPELVNGPEDSYDVTNVRIQYYRTQANGDALTFVTELTNGTTNYNDNNSDSSIANNTILYTEGGVLSNDAPPLCKYVHVANSSCFYAHIKDGTNIYGYRILQSVVDDPDSVPAGNFIDLDKPITGLSSFSDRVIAFSKNATYRIDGSFDETGAGGLTYQKISDTIGCVSNRSIVQLPMGVVFADEDGFCFTDGFKVFRITDQLVKRYKNLVKTEVQRDRIYGTYDKENRRVYWAVQEDESVLADNNKLFILDTRWGIKPESVFTTMSGGNRISNNFGPSALVFRDKEMIRADKQGYVFKHNEELLSNPYIQSLVPTAQWDTAAIIYNFKSIITSFGETKLRKFTPKMIMSLENVSNLSMDIISITDLKKLNTLAPLRFRGNWIWGDPLFKWREPTFKWGGTGFIQQQRMFDSNDLRCTYKQLQLTNSKTIIANSDALDTVTANSTLKTITFDNPADFDWPENVKTYSISFENDGYVNEFSIISRSDDTLVLEDAANLMPNGVGQKWHMVGYAKDEILSLLTLTVLFSYLGATQDYYSPNSVGSNV